MLLEVAPHSFGRGLGGGGELVAAGFGRGAAGGVYESGPAVAEAAVGEMAELLVVGAYTDDWEPHYAESWANASYARPGGESLEQLRTRAVDTVRTLAHHNRGQIVLAASHGTFISQALSGFGMPIDWAVAQSMPMPAIYRLRFTDPSTNPQVSGLA